MKQWQAEFRGNDLNATIGLVDIFGEHMRLIRAALPTIWAPSESPDWQPFPPHLEAVLTIDPAKHRMRISTALQLAPA